MKNYKEFKKQYAKKRNKFDKATENMMVIDNSSKDIKTMLDGLKPAKLKQLKDKLRLAIRISDSNYTNLK